MKTVLIATLLTAALAVPAVAQSQSHHGTGHGMMTPVAAQAKVTATGSVNSINAGKRTINMTHEPIAALGWPAMTMDFAVAEGVDLTKLQPGAKVSFSLAKGADGIYMIDEIGGK